MDAASYPNIRDAHRVMWEDNIPLPYMQGHFDQGVLPGLQRDFSVTKLAWAEAELAALRQPGDVGKLDSPLWILCAGEESEQQAVLGRCQDGQAVQQVLDYLFDSLTGPAPGPESAPAQPGPAPQPGPPQSAPTPEEMAGLIRDLLVWASQTGGWEARVWRRAERMAARAEAAGLVPPAA